MGTIWNIVKKYGSAALDLARRLVIYACLASVLIAGWILDRLDPPEKT